MCSQPHEYLTKSSRPPNVFPGHEIYAGYMSFPRVTRLTFGRHTSQHLIRDTASSRGVSTGPISFHSGLSILSLTCWNSRWNMDDSIKITRCSRKRLGAEPIAACDVAMISLTVGEPSHADLRLSDQYAVVIGSKKSEAKMRPLTFPVRRYIISLSVRITTTAWTTGCFCCWSGQPITQYLFPGTASLLRV